MAAEVAPDKPKRTNPGRVFEAELARSLRELIGWPWPRIPDDSFGGRHRAAATALRPADFVVTAPGGRAMWIEAKQVRDLPFPLKNLRPHQPDVLRMACEWGALGYLLINHRNAAEGVNETYAVAGAVLAEFIAAATRRSLPLEWLTDGANALHLRRYQFEDLAWGWDVRQLVPGMEGHHEASGLSAA